MHTERMDSEQREWARLLLAYFNDHERAEPVYLTGVCAFAASAEEDGAEEREWFQVRSAPEAHFPWSGWISARRILSGVDHTEQLVGECALEVAG